MSPIAIDKDQAAAILNAAVGESRDRVVSEEWARRTRRLDEAATTKTYIAALGTALLARATDARIDPMSIKASDNVARAYSARMLCHEVLVPASRVHGFDLGVTGREPLNNQPFFRYERIDQMDRIRDRVGLLLLLASLRKIDQLSAAEAGEALASFLYERTAVADLKRRTTLLDVALGVRQAVRAADCFVREEADGGKRGQALVAGVLDLVFPEVRMGRVNDPSRRFPGDVQAMVGVQVVLAVEVRQKLVGPDEALAFARAAAEAGVVNAAVAGLSPLVRSRCTARPFETMPRASMAFFSPSSRARTNSSPQHCFGAGCEPTMLCAICLNGSWTACTRLRQAKGASVAGWSCSKRRRRASSDERQLGRRCGEPRHLRPRAPRSEGQSSQARPAQHRCVGRVRRSGRASPSSIRSW